MKASFKGKCYLLTGASRGIGALVARSLLGQGAMIVGIARDFKCLEQLKQTLSSEEMSLFRIQKLDLTHRTELNTWIEQAWAEYGPFDGVIHNAGVDDFQPSEVIDPTTLMRQVDLNLTAPLLINRGLLPHFLAQGHGTFVHMSSVAGYLPVPYGAVYSATKAALLSYNEALAIEYYDTPLCFVSLHPAFVHGSGMHERHKQIAGNAPFSLGSTTDEAVVAAVSKALLGKGLTQNGPRIINRLPTRPLIMLLHAMPTVARWIIVRLVKPYLAKIARASKIP